MKEAQTSSTGVCAPTPKDSPVTTVTDHLACAGTSPKGAPQPCSRGTALTQQSSLILTAVPRRHRFRAFLGSCPSLLIHTSVYGRLACFQLLDIRTRLLVNVLALVFLWTIALVSPGGRRREGLPGKRSCLTISAGLLSKGADHFKVPLAPPCAPTPHICPQLLCVRPDTPHLHFWLWHCDGRSVVLTFVSLTTMMLSTSSFSNIWKSLLRNSCSDLFFLLQQSR